VTEPVTLAWRDGEVSGIWQRPPGPARATLVLGHGAGGDMNQPTLAAIAEGMAGSGVAVLRFNFPYRQAGRKAPDPQDRLEACYWAIAKDIAGSAERLFL